MRRLLLSIALTLTALVGRGQQQTIEGWVRDSVTAQPLLFAAVGVPGTAIGTLTDSAGRFVLTLPASVSLLHLSHLGYQTRRVRPANLLLVNLPPLSNTLAEVVVRPGPNPADRLIEQAIARKTINDPERWPFLAVDQYQKMTLAPLADAPPLNASGPTRISRLLGKGLHEADLFICETASHLTYRSVGQWHEQVEGYKTSGTNSNLVASMLPDMQFFSLYGDFLRLNQKEVRTFVGPLSPNSPQRYAFTLRDTLTHATDTLYVIDYEPRPGTTFEGLRGTLHLHAHDLALTYASATPADPTLVLRFQTEHHYNRLPDTRQWMPAYARTYWTWQLADNLFNQPVGVTLQTWYTNPDRSPQAAAGYNPLARVFQDDANRRDDAFWESRRTQPLTDRDQRTYQRFRDMPVLKRVAIAGAFKMAEAKLGGVVPLGVVELPLVYALGGNLYEGARLGLGLQTSRRFSKYVRFDGFAAYGLRDGAAKWGGGMLLRSGLDERFRLRLAYRRDVWEPGNVEFFRDKLPLIPYESIRNFLVSRADSLRQFRAELAWRPHRYGQVFLTYLHEQRQATYGYQFMSRYGDQLMPYNAFQVREVSLATRFAFGETFRQVGEGQALQQPSRLTVMAQVGRGIPVMMGGFAYTKAHLLLEARQPIRGLGETILNLSVGKVWGDLPLPFLVHARGSRTTLSPLWIANHLQTADPYEFVSDTYLHAFLNHSFGSLLARPKTAWFRPELSVQHSLAWGSLAHPDHHKGIPIKTLEAGLQESGLTIDNLLRLRLAKAAYLGAGGGFFYRWGANRLPNPADNRVWRLVWNVSF